MTAATGTVTHVAGLDVSFCDYLRQRCAWCGAVLIDQDLTRVARPVEDADRPFPRWPVGALVEVTGGYPKVSTVVGGSPARPAMASGCPTRAACAYHRRSRNDK